MDRIKNALTQKVGPLPAWAWAAIILGGILAYWFFTKSGPFSSATGGGAAASGSGAPSDLSSLLGALGANGANSSNTAPVWTNPVGAQAAMNQSSVNPGPFVDASANLDRGSSLAAQPAFVAMASAPVTPVAGQSNYQSIVATQGANAPGFNSGYNTGLVYGPGAAGGAVAQGAGIASGGGGLFAAAANAARSIITPVASAPSAVSQAIQRGGANRPGLR